MSPQCIVSTHLPMPGITISARAATRKACWPGPLTARCQARNGTEVTSQPADHALVAVHDAKNIPTDRDFHSSEGHWDDDDVLIIYSYCSCAVAMKVTETDLHLSHKNSAVLEMTKICWYLNLTDWCQEIVPAWQEKKERKKQSSWLSRTFFKTRTSQFMPRNAVPIEAWTCAELINCYLHLSVHARDFLWCEAVDCDLSPPRLLPIKFSSTSGKKIIF